MKVEKLLVASIAFSLLTASIGAIATESQECHELRKINKYLLSLKGLKSAIINLFKCTYRYPKCHVLLV